MPNNSKMIASLRLGRAFTAADMLKLTMRQRAFLVHHERLHEFRNGRSDLLDELRNPTKSDVVRDLLKNEGTAIMSLAELGFGDQRGLPSTKPQPRE